MPIDPGTIALVSAGSNLLGQVYNTAAQGKMNNKMIQYNRDMYDAQRRDRLADWAMQNDYNSPTSQMARLREAGLNPNLVYGNGAVNQAGPIKSADVQGYNPKAPEFRGNPVADYFNTKIQQQQLDNLKAANTVQVQEALLKAATTANTAASTARSQFELKQSESLAQNSLDMARESLRKLQLESGQIGAQTEKTRADTKYTLNQDERAAAQNAASLKVAAETVLKMRAETATTQQQQRNLSEQLRGIKADNALKELDLRMRQMGIQPGDGMFMRLLGRIITGDLSPMEILRNLEQSFDRNLEFQK